MAFATDFLDGLDVLGEANRHFREDKAWTSEQVEEKRQLLDDAFDFLVEEKMTKFNLSIVKYYDRPFKRESWL